jgi:hypothetical protein
MLAMQNVSDKFLVLKIAKGIGYPEECPIALAKICDTESEAIEVARLYPVAFVQKVIMVSNPMAKAMLDRLEPNPRQTYERSR